MFCREVTDVSWCAATRGGPGRDVCVRFVFYLSIDDGSGGQVVRDLVNAVTEGRL